MGYDEEKTFGGNVVKQIRIEDPELLAALQTNGTVQLTDSSGRVIGEFQPKV